ncbi:MAG: tRNA threonylcarbamoyladenosine dehydratase [Bacteriovoracaceae bacterium]
MEQFRAIESLYGKSAVQTLLKSHVCIIGLGGVGSWSAEALIRSGIGKITLIDLDEICITNTNRQIHANTKTVGKSKIEILKSRFLKINPEAQIELIHDFITKENISRIEKLHAENPIDFIIDAVDGVSAKCSIISCSKELNIPIITTGAAAGKVDPTKIQVSDISLTQNDRLLKQVKRLLKKEYGFPREKGKLGVMSASSIEKASMGGNSSCEVKTGKLDCDGSLGSVCFVTASVGFAASSYVTNWLSNSRGSSLDESLS